MTVLLDTNIIMDALQERHPFDAATIKSEMVTVIL